MTDPLLKIERLSLHAGDTPILRDVSFQLASGRTLALIGESGSGKSMTALAILGLLPAGVEVSAKTRISFAGAPLPLGDERRMRALRGTRMAVVFQDPMACLNPFMRVGSQIDEAVMRAGIRGATERHARVVRLLSEVELPDPQMLAQRYPHQLSGGQQQRVMIAIALAGEPELLIADEPTSALDAAVQAEIVHLLAGLQKRRNMAMLFITHDLSVASVLARDVAVMRLGEIVETGTAAGVLSAPRHDYTARLVEARRMLREPRTAAIRSGGKEIVSANGLCVAYPARGLFGKPAMAVHDVSLRIEAGRTLGVLGHSGSGKSTLAAALAGLMPPAAGTVSLLGHRLDGSRPGLPRSVRRSVQYVFQNPYGALNPRLSVGRLMDEPLALAGVAPAERARRIRSALEEVGLKPEHEARYPHQLSGGQRQRVCIARALLCEPKLLVCDEVISALDMSTQFQILALLKRLQADHGFAMLFIGHDVEAVRWVSDEVLVMDRGRAVERVSVDVPKTRWSDSPEPAVPARREPVFS